MPSHRPRGLGRQRVLVVEDDLAIAKLLTIVLEQNAFDVTHVSDRSGAMTAIQDAEPALIMLDVGLPDGSGLDLLKWIRDDLGLSVPVVMVSAYRQDANVERAFELGANDFVAKPFRPKELMARVQRALGQ